jgi:eukaryotic-like serine/threonine-protein kinase
MRVLTPATLTGARLGVYEVQSPIGAGGMATVYRGFDHNLERPVAIKVLSEAAAAQPGFIDRFRQEARLIASLRHPNIVHIYDFGQYGPIVYMVQELLPGPTLAERLAELSARGQPMPRVEIMQVAHQLSAALDAAHAAGIIHRDVKPSNALWNAHGALVLTDFGIAKNTLVDVSQTQTGVVLGTPVYVSPEQARGEPLTPASDIYALAVVLYEMIGGKPPFESPTPLALVLKHLQEPAPELRLLRTSLPPAAEAVMQRGLAKQPHERFVSAGELVRALEAAWPAPQPFVAAGDVHSLPTTAWQPAGQSKAPHVPPVPAPAALSNARPAAPVPAARGKPLTLPLLAGLLALLLLGGVALAMRGEQPAAGPSLAATAQSEPATEATSAPAAQTEPTAAPTADTPAGPLAGVRAQLGEPPPALAGALDAAEAALASGDSTAAAGALGELQRALLQARRNAEISAEQMRAALAELQAVAEANGVELPLSFDS